MTQIKTIISIFLLLCIAKPADAVSDNLKQWLNKLDESLEKAPMYEAEHEQHINAMKKLLTRHESLNKRFETFHGIYLAYQSYRADSAIVYAYKSLTVAKQMRRKDYEIVAMCNIAHICITSGDNIQAFRIMKSIDVSGMPTWVKIEYYKTMHKLWEEQKVYFVSNKPQKNDYSIYENQCTDSLLAITKPQSSDWYKFSIVKAALQDDNDRVICLANEAVKREKDKHRMAAYYMEEALAYRRKSNEEMAIISFIKSAICDNESTTREITSLYNVGSSIQHFDNVKANQYVSKALEFINFYNAPIRLIALSKIMPAVEKTKLDMVKQQRDIFFVLFLCVIVVVCVLAGAYVYNRRLNRKLKLAQQQNRQNLEALNATNEQLMKTNKQLLEADKVKNEYIGRTLYDASEYIESLEHIFNKVNKAVMTRRYSDIGNVTSQEYLNNERKTIFRNFDKTFLVLFPNFVEQYNILFNEGDRKYPSEENTLTSEMRIFALIRMGIKESDRIARYLGYSVHTVNTYKTRAKNRSCVGNDEFETRIMSF